VISSTFYAMRTYWSLAAVATAALASSAHAQWISQPASTTASLRGLDPLSDNVAWASGTKGTFLWTNNGGTEWHVDVVPGAGTLDFRAVHAVSLDTAYLMASAQDTGRIYYTTDRGKHWKAQYDQVGKGIFLDAIGFFDRTHGIVLGDPIDGHFTLLRTNDAGMHWIAATAEATPPALAGEAAFAASGTALVVKGPRHAWFATGGGSEARVFRTTNGGGTWQVSTTPIVAGSASRGIFSLAFTDTLHGIAVGGDYSSPDSAAVAAAYTNDGGVTWTSVPACRATAYLSGAAYVPKTNGKSLVAVGTKGTSYSVDAGRSWRVLNAWPFNAVAASRDGRVWAVGERGQIATLLDLHPTGSPTAP